LIKLKCYIIFLLYNSKKMSCFGVYVGKALANLDSMGIDNVSVTVDDILNNINEVVDDIQNGLSIIVYINMDVAYANIEDGILYLYFQVCSDVTSNEDDIKSLFKDNDIYFLTGKDVKSYSTLYLDDINNSKKTLNFYLTKFYDSYLGSKIKVSRYVKIYSLDSAALSLHSDDKLEDKVYANAVKLYNRALELRDNGVRNIYNYIINNEVDDLYVDLNGTLLHINNDINSKIEVYIHLISIYGKPISTYDNIQQTLYGGNIARKSLYGGDINGILLNSDYDMVIEYIEDNMYTNFYDLPPLSKNENDILEEVD
ncbi:Hypothetical protein ORPV_1129, partial [Orpheovirus IHUMI-LCC2]